MSKIWEYNNSEGTHVHPSQINPQFEMVEGHPTLSFDSKMPDGRQVHNKIRLTPMDPLGFGLEFLEGPLAGSKAFTYYIPKGNETGVTVVGEYTSQWMAGEQLKQAVLKNNEAVFNEDQANLSKMM